MNVKPHLNKMVAPCWRSLEPMGALGQNTFQEIWEGEQAQKLREKFLNSEKAEGCQRCWSVEEGKNSTAISLRNRYNEKYKRFLPDVIESLEKNKPLKLKSAEIRFSSLCNFRCLHCHPSHSSRWQKLRSENTEIQKIIPVYEKDYPLKIVSEDQIDEFIHNYSDTLEEFWICGGEPFIEPLHYSFLNKYPEDKAKNVDLIVCTNFSILSIPNFNLSDLWKKFKTVDVRIGIDGDELSYDYFRFGGSVQVLRDNIIEARSWGLENLKVGGVCTVNILNISRLKQIYKMSKKWDMKFHYTFLNGHPNLLDIRNLPLEWKDRFSREIKEILNEKEILDTEVECLENIITFMNSKDDYPEEIINLKKYCENMDKVSGLRWQDHLPELEGLL